MPRILFPASSAPGKDEVEGSGRLINAYSEKLQDGAPAQYVIRRAPGLVGFSETEATSFRGLWYDGGGYIYAAWSEGLYLIEPDGTETFIAAIPTAQLTYLTSADDDSNLSEYTFASQDLGAAHSNRRIVVAVLFSSSGNPPTAVTVGGESATLVDGTGLLGLYIAHVPEGATGDVVVTFNSGSTRCAIGLWRIDGLTSDTGSLVYSNTFNVTATTALVPFALVAPEGGPVISVVRSDTTVTWGAHLNPIVQGLTEDFEEFVESAVYFSGASAQIGTADGGQYAGARIQVPSGTATAVIASWRGPDDADAVTFAKNNKAPVADQVLCTGSRGAYTFTSSSITPLSVNDDLPNSVCYGDGYFFFTTAGGLCYASGINGTTVNSLDVIRAEARAEPLVRGVFRDGELYLFGQTHTEVWASNGNPNPTGFPLNRTTVIWRGIVGTLAVCGFEEGFEGGLFFVADDNSVRLLSGYQPQTISTPDVERAIEACSNKSAIRCFVYDLDGHACVVVDIAGEATWVYDLTEGGRWHERKSDAADAWKLTGNSVRAFGKWIAGDRTSGNLYQIDPSTFDEDGDTLSFVAESIAMEAFPQRLQVPRADFNFGMGVGTDDVDEPQVKIQWSDDGGHTWSDPLTASLGEKGRRKMQVRKNRLGLTGTKGRRFRLTVDDPVYVALLAGSMEVEARR